MKFGDAEYLEQLNRAKTRIISISVDRFDLGSALIFADEEAARLREATKLSEGRRAELLVFATKFRDSSRSYYRELGMPEQVRFWVTRADEALASQPRPKILDVVDAARQLECNCFTPAECKIKAVQRAIAAMERE